MRKHLKSVLPFMSLPHVKVKNVRAEEYSQEGYKQYTFSGSTKQLGWRPKIEKVADSEVIVKFSTDVNERAECNIRTYLHFTYNQFIQYYFLRLKKKVRLFKRAEEVAKGRSP